MLVPDYEIGKHSRGHDADHCVVDSVINKPQAEEGHHGQMQRLGFWRPPENQSHPDQPARNNRDVQPT